MEQRVMNRAKTSGRTDDNLESLRKRFKTFENDTLPIINIFEKNDQLVKVRWIITELYIYLTQ